MIIGSLETQICHTTVGMYITEREPTGLSVRLLYLTSETIQGGRPEQILL